MPRTGMTVVAKPRPVASMPERMVALDRLQPAPLCLERPPTAEELAGEARHDGPIVVRSIPDDPRQPIVVLGGLERLARLRQAGNATAYVRVAEAANQMQALAAGWSAAPEPRRDPVRLGQALRGLLPMLWGGDPDAAGRFAALAHATGFAEPDIERVLVLAEAVEDAGIGAAGYTRDALAAMPPAALRRLLAESAAAAAPPAAPPAAANDNTAPMAAAPAPDLPPLPTVAEVADLPKGAFRAELTRFLPAATSVDDLATAFAAVDPKTAPTRSSFDATLSGKRSNPATIERLLLAIRALRCPTAWPGVAAAVAARRKERAAGDASPGQRKRAAPTVDRAGAPRAADPAVPPEPAAAPDRNAGPHARPTAAPEAADAARPADPPDDAAIPRPA